MRVFSGIGDFLKYGLLDILDWEIKKRLIKAAEYVIVKCGGVPRTQRREPRIVVPPAPVHSAPAKTPTDQRLMN